MTEISLSPDAAIVGLVPGHTDPEYRSERPRSQGRRLLAVGRYLRSPDVAIPGAILLIIAFFCFLGPFILPIGGPNSGLAADSLIRPFHRGHIFGTDIQGDDIFTLLLYGGRVSFEVGFGAVAIGLTIGTTVGLVAGYMKGLVDGFIMRCLDVLLAFPALILALAIVTFLGTNERNVILAISFFTIPSFARLARAQTLRVSEREFVVASRAVGSRVSHVVFRQLLPNVVTPLITYAFLQVGAAMLIEASLSFLGLGVKVPTPTWGNMISGGENFLLEDPWLVIIPGLALFLTIVSLNLFANGLLRILTGESST